MDARDALFEDIRAISDDADAQGLHNVSLVLEFAMDVFLHETDAKVARETPPKVPHQSAPATPQRALCLDWSMSSFPLGQTHRKAS